MKDIKKYIFTSERLGFRNWDLRDLDKMHEINSDEKVMEFFSSVSNRQQTTEFVEKKRTNTRVFLLSI